MKFIVLFLCLTINYLWLKDRGRFNPAWLFRNYASFRAWLDGLFPAASGDDAASVPPLLQRLLPPLLACIVPLTLLGVLLSLFGDGAFYIPAILLHSAVVLAAFLRASDPASSSNLSGSALVYRSFETIFVVFFWYVLLGPMAVLLCYISYLLRDYHSGQGNGAPAHYQEQPTLTIASRLLWLLEWLPLRLLGLTFSLAGNFVRSFGSLRDSFWASWKESNQEALYDYARSALQEEGSSAAPQETDAASGDQESLALQGLLERSQIIWLLLLAFITLLGFGLE